LFVPVCTVFQVWGLTFYRISRPSGHFDCRISPLYVPAFRALAPFITFSCRLQSHSNFHYFKSSSMFPAASSGLDNWRRKPCLFPSVNSGFWTTSNKCVSVDPADSKRMLSNGYTSKVKIRERYAIVGFISSGTYGRVYKAVGKNGQKGEFAIKKSVIILLYLFSTLTCLVDSNPTKKAKQSSTQASLNLPFEKLPCVQNSPIRT
jgi:hypothetical protein